MRLEEVTDVELLRKAAKLLEAENQRLGREVVELRRKLHELKGGDPKQLMLELQGLEEQLQALRRRVFAPSSEKRALRKASIESESTEQRGHSRREQPELERVEELHVIDEADKVCPICGKQLEQWAGQFEESDEVDVIERRFVLKKHKRQKYRCRCGQCIETAPGPVKLFEGARYSPSFAISVAISKYADHAPLERQVRVMQREGLQTDSQTLWDQLNALGRLLEPAYQKLKAHVLSHSVVGADETRWRLMGEKSQSKKAWHVWALAAPNAVYYEIADSRSAEAARNLLNGYSGTIVCDGYSAYEALQKSSVHLKLAHCWAHVRRRFVEIEGSYPGPCGEVLDLIGQLYAVERKAVGPPEARLQQRRQESKAIIDKIQKWALETQALPQTGLAKAIAYMGGMWNGLLVFLEDPNVELDNNRTERAIRGVVLGRKNHYGSRSKRGTEVAALFYSLIESAKLAGVEPHAYLNAATLAALRGESIPLPHEIA